MKIGLLGLLTIIFVICKVAGIINWSWWLVLLPSLIGGALVILLVAFMAVIAAAMNN